MERLFIGDKIRALREDMGVTQLKMSADLKCSAKMISNYELNKRQPDLATLKAICDYLSVSADFLLDRTNCSQAACLANTGLEEKRLLDSYRELPENLRKDVLRFVKLNLLDCSVNKQV